MQRLYKHAFALYCLHFSPLHDKMRILILIIVFECSRCQAAALLFRSIWGKHYYIICKAKVPPAPHAERCTGATGKRLVPSAAVVVVSELNTLLALEPLINKTSPCIREGFGAASPPQSHFPWMHRGRCASALTPQKHKYSHTRAGFSPLGAFLPAVSHHIFPLHPIFTLKIFMFIQKIYIYHL